MYVCMYVCMYVRIYLFIYKFAIAIVFLHILLACFGIVCYSEQAYFSKYNL